MGLSPARHSHLTADGLTGWPDAVAWHDIECASYAADLPLWRELADQADGPILDLGCGTGRVALDLAVHGHDVTALDYEPAFVQTLSARAIKVGLEIRTEVADVRSFRLNRQFPLVIAPMHLVHVISGDRGRLAMLQCAQRHLRQGGRFAGSISDASAWPARASPVEPLLDMREASGWVYSSRATEVVPTHENRLVVRRVRTAVSPSGALEEKTVEVGLERVSARELEQLGIKAGLSSAERRPLPREAGLTDSAVVVLTS